MNRKQRRAQTPKSLKNHKRAVLTGMTATGLVASTFGAIPPAVATDSTTYSSCYLFGGGLNDMVFEGVGRTFNLDFTGTCLINRFAIPPSFTGSVVINGPSGGGLTLSLASGENEFLFDQATHSLTLRNLTFKAAEPNTSFSSILSLYAGVTTHLEHVNFQDMSTNAGAIYVEGHLDVSDSRFERITTNGNGGAIYTSYGYAPDISIAHSIFANNSVSSQGGAVFINGGSLDIDSSEFTSNRAQDYGGAISASGTGVTIDHSTFTSNTSVNLSGGAIFSEGAVTVKNSTFFDNHAVNGLGGAVASPNYSADVDNSTFVNNSAADGGAMFSEGGIVSNSTFWNNPATTSGTNASVFTAGASMFGNILANSNSTPVIGGGDTDLGANLYTDASFAKTTTGVGASKLVTLASLKLKAIALNKTLPTNSGATKTVALGEGSSARNYYAANSAGISPSYNSVSRLASHDQRGAARPADGNYDVGAFEAAVPAPTPAPKPSVTHKTILFNGNSSKLTSHAKAQLRALATSVQANGVHKITLNGHTATLTKADPSGRKFRGLLAGARTRAVEKYLNAQFKKAGYSVTITRVIKGAATPAKSNRTEKGRKANRRVYVTVQ